MGIYSIHPHNTWIAKPGATDKNMPIALPYSGIF
jgi:hypothetical protein